MAIRILHLLLATIISQSYLNAQGLVDDPAILDKTGSLVLERMDGELNSQLLLSIPTLHRLVSFKTIGDELFIPQELMDEGETLQRRLHDGIVLKINDHRLVAQPISLVVDVSQDIGQGMAVMAGSFVTVNFKWADLPRDIEKMALDIELLTGEELEINAVLNLGANGTAAHIFTAKSPSVLWTFGEDEEAITGLNPNVIPVSGWVWVIVAMMVMVALTLMERGLVLGAFVMACTAAGIGTWPLSNPQYTAPDRSKLEAVAISALKRSYLGFNCRTAEELYECLSRYTSGKALESLYSELFRELFDGGQIKATREVTTIDIISVDLSSIQEATRPESVMVTVRARWRVAGLVRHRQHIHRKVIENLAQLKLAHRVGRWKIVELMPLRQIPLEGSS